MTKRAKRRERRRMGMKENKANDHMAEDPDSEEEEREEESL